MLELACPKSFRLGWRVRRLPSQHLTYPRLFSWPGWELESARPISELLNPDENKRAKKETWARPIPKLFHTERENPTDLAPTPGETQEDSKNKSTASWRDITSNTQLKKSPRSKRQLVQIHSNNSSKILKMCPKDPEFLYKEAYKVHLYKEERCAQILQSLAVNFVIRRSVTPGFLKNKTRLIICVPRKSTHMSEWKSIKTMFI
jgi:hypothetical protein